MQASSIQTSIASPIDWQTKAHQLVLEARKYPAGSYQQNRCLSQIIRLVAPKLWKYYTPYYADALQQTWLYFAKNICTTYDPNRASIVTWLNRYLRYRHQDLVNQSLTRQYQEIPIETESNGRDGSFTKVMEIPTWEYGSLSLLKEIIEWVKTDADRKLQSTHIQHRPDINCQTLILLRLPPETPWKVISARFGVPIPTLSSFYRRNCIPYLQKLLNQSGFVAA